MTARRRAALLTLMATAGLALAVIADAGRSAPALASPSEQVVTNISRQSPRPSHTPQPTDSPTDLPTAATVPTYQVSLAPPEPPAPSGVDSVTSGPEIGSGVSAVEQTPPGLLRVPQQQAVAAPHATGDITLILVVLVGFGAVAVGALTMALAMPDRRRLRR